MNGFTAPGFPDAVTTTVAALVTLVVLGGLLGERRAFGWTQHLFAGLLTGFLALVAVTEVLVPWIAAPLVEDPLGRPELWLGLALVASAAVAPWLPRSVVSIPLSIAIGALAAFALGGAVIGTALPQLAVTVPAPGSTGVETAATVASAAVTVLVLLSFLSGTPRGRILGTATATGRWMLVAGIGGWIGYLLFSRLILLVDRIGFLLGDWLGVGR
ncbi:MAG TPA: hypothetical protein VLA76_00495 [Candidatus Angelobacter sp.]|nr:hypothetical protein [Candidatus Angelobacter sp.]